LSPDIGLRKRKISPREQHRVGVTLRASLGNNEDLANALKLFLGDMNVKDM
jgi:NADH:ubiquinone oxidoreductase subunit H